MKASGSDGLAPPRERILRAATELLASGGLAAVSTRSVSAAAGVQGPTIYRQFGDMRGLLEAVASRGFADYLSTKAAREPLADPVDDLRAGWDLHVEFGLRNPAVYALIYGTPRPGIPSAAAQAAHGLLVGLVERVAEAGRLRTGVESAAQMISAAGVGVVLSLLALPAEARDMSLSTAAREAVLTALTTPPDEADAAGAPEDDRTAVHAVQLRSALSRNRDAYTAAELALFEEWLDRLIEDRSGRRT